jgi:rSAM/selenodomain-associated transferase 1
MQAPRRSAHRSKASRRRAAPFRCRLVVFAKAPVAGAVKTRLAREVGVTQATRFVRAATAALLGRVGADPRWQTVIAVAPDLAAASRCWPHGLSRMPQGGGDLGTRMQRIIDALPPGPALIVGTDVPGITRGHIAQAFCLLGRHVAVFGPAADGGYWLVGLKRRPRRLAIFANVRWSSPHALADTLANLRARTVAFAATLGDVDDAEALAAHAARFGRRILPAPGDVVVPSPLVGKGQGGNVTCSA